MVLDVTDIFEELFGECRKHNEYSCQISYDCPMCDDDKHSGNLEINYQDSIFKCWSCCEINKMQGRIPYLLKRFGKKDSLKNYLLLKPDSEYVSEKEQPKIIVKLPEGYIKLSECKNKDYQCNLALKYLYKRGITDDIIEEYNIGYTCIGTYFDRIIIPSYDENDKLNYFISRWYSKKYNKIKYLNPSVEKQEIVFNENKINWDSTIYLVEGVFDHIVIPNSIPLLGKFISEKLFNLLYEKSSVDIIIVLDGEDSAYKDAITIYKSLNHGDLVGRVKIVRPPEDEDPSSIFEKFGSKGIINLIRTAKKLKDDELCGYFCF